MGKDKKQPGTRSIGDTPTIDIVGIVSDLNPNNINAALESFGKEEQPQEPSETEFETVSNEVSEPKESNKETEDKEKSLESTTFSVNKEKTEDTNQNDGDLFSYKNIVKKSKGEDSQLKTIWLRKETLDMLESIRNGCDINIPKATLVHNLVSAFLQENLTLLKKNYAAKAKEKKKKDYLI